MTTYKTKNTTKTSRRTHFSIAKLTTLAVVALVAAATTSIVVAAPVPTAQLSPPPHPRTESPSPLLLLGRKPPISRRLPLRPPTRPSTKCPRRKLRLQLIRPCSRSRRATTASPETGTEPSHAAASAPATSSPVPAAASPASTTSSATPAASTAAALQGRDLQDPPKEGQDHQRRCQEGGRRHQGCHGSQRTVDRGGRRGRKGGRCRWRIGGCCDGCDGRGANCGRFGGRRGGCRGRWRQCGWRSGGCGSAGWPV
ncbi:hypothetical protein BCR44DRAFT_1426906, partial [Catenaria anguillulae PL171]